MMKIVYCSLGGVFVALGFIGAFLPLLPTTPFLILALMCFTRGSDKLHRWLLSHRILGKYLKDWETYRVIPLRAKVTATVMMLGSLGYLALMSSLSLTGVAGVAILFLIVLAYIWHFPSNCPRTDPSEANSGST